MDERELPVLEVTQVEGVVRRTGSDHDDVVHHDAVEHRVGDEHVLRVQQVALGVRRGADHLGDGGEHRVDVDRGLRVDDDALGGGVTLDQRNHFLEGRLRRHRFGAAGSHRRRLAVGESRHLCYPSVVSIFSDEDRRIDTNTTNLRHVQS